VSPIHPPAARPTHRRYGVIAFAVTLAVITYIDRVCISQAAPAMRADLGLSEQQMGWAFSAFFWAYALFEIPSGWLGDRIGARRVLLRVVTWWSLFTAATGWVRGATSLILTRALFGAGEAGCFPNLTRAFTTWLPHAERVRAQGWMWLAARWGGAFTPLVVVVILQYLSWRLAFSLFGVLGIVWAVAFFAWYRDDPRKSQHIDAEELALLPSREEVTLGEGRVPWSRLLASRTIRLLWLQFFCLNFGAVFYITWLPTYLQEARGFDLAHHPWIRTMPWLASHPPFVMALFAGIPLFFGGLGSLFCGYVADPLARRLGSVKTARRLLAGGGFLGAALLLACSLLIRDPLLAILSMGLASFCNDLAMPPSWSACMDIGGKIAGTLSGSMNMMGNFGGAVAALVVGHILAWSHHNWSLAIAAAAVSYFAGAFCWLGIDPVAPIAQTGDAPSNPSAI
jgi:MFS family permease